MRVTERILSISDSNNSIKEDRGRWCVLKNGHAPKCRRQLREIHFLAEMRCATATLASRIALGLLANSIRGKATKQKFES